MSSYPIRRTASLSPLLFAIILISSSNGLGQTSPSNPSGQPQPKPSPSLEKKFLLNILRDQRAIWTSPFHLEKGDARWLAPIGLSTMTLIATDRHTSGELVENGDNLSRLRISKNVSRLGSLYTTAGTAGVIYLTGRATHNDRLRETGLLSAEALIDSTIVVNALQTASQRQRPPADNSSGEFFDGGSSFPSGHSADAWSVATVIAMEYGHKHRLVKVAAYGVASAVSLSRYTGRNHFLSDVLVGSAIGYGIGRYVYHKHHDPALDDGNQQKHDDLVHLRLFPRIAPVYNAHAHLYGASLAWDF